jgi:KDO2-lipid IV(A) lauroyltransferase
MEKGGAVGLLVDQHFTRGPMIEFFGHKARANPLLPKLARQFDCPVYPARCIRLPEGRFRIELQEAITLPRNEKDEIDVAGSTQMINAIIEGWVREYPAQWLWLHNRWRGGDL